MGLMPAKGEYLSKQKFDALTRELEQLENEGRREIARRLEYGKSLGDLSENAEYQEARDAQGALEDRIAKLRYLLKNATLVEEHHSNVVELGSTVVVQKEGDASPRRFLIVGSEEVSLGNGKVSNDSPIGSALLGKTKGDTIHVASPRGSATYTIINIE